MKYHVRSIGVCDNSGGQFNIWICLSPLRIHRGHLHARRSAWQHQHNGLHIRQSRSWPNTSPYMLSVEEVHKTLTNVSPWSILFWKLCRDSSLICYRIDGGQLVSIESVLFSPISRLPTVVIELFSNAVIISTESLFCTLMNVTQRSSELSYDIPAGASDMFVELSDVCF